VKVLTNVPNGYLLASAFSPNGDMVNDCFGVKLWGGIKSIDFSVYNRWGERVFHTNNPNDCWDGTYKGEKQPPGAFVYFIQANTTCGPVSRKGTVVLIR
jgi:gliding motility-associated-like protein